MSLPILDDETFPPVNEVKAVCPSSEYKTGAILNPSISQYLTPFEKTALIFGVAPGFASPAKFIIVGFAWSAMAPPTTLHI